MNRSSDTNTVIRRKNSPSFSFVHFLFYVVYESKRDRERERERKSMRAQEKGRKRSRQTAK